MGVKGTEEGMAISRRVVYKKAEKKGVEKTEKITVIYRGRNICRYGECVVG